MPRDLNIKHLCRDFVYESLNKGNKIEFLERVIKKIIMMKEYWLSGERNFPL